MDGLVPAGNNLPAKFSDLEVGDLEGLSEEEVDELLTEAEDLVRVRPGDYVPHDKQLQFHCAKHKIRAIFAGNRFGKTEAGCLEAWYHASGEYPDWYPMENRIKTANRGRIIIVDFKKGGKEVLEPKLKVWFDPSRTKYQRFLGHIEKITVKHRTGGESSIDIMTHEQGELSFEGWSGHWAWFDEPPPQPVFTATMRGLVDFDGRCWLTLTPISEPWLFDEIVGKSDDRRVWHVTGSIWDNPHLTKQAVDDFLATLPEDEREAREFGKFRHLVGLVYKEFDQDVHIVPSSRLDGSARWPVWFVLDPADRRPHHGIWFKVNPFGQMFVFAELVFKGTIEQTSKHIMQREIMMKIDPLKVIRILDPNKGNSPSPSTGLKLVDEFAKHAVYFTATVNDDLALGHLAVKERLWYDKKQPISHTNCPSIYFVKGETMNCTKQIMSYVWDDWRGANRGSRSEKETPKDINKDMPDCVRYGCVSNPQWYDTNDEHDPVEFSGFRKPGGSTGYGR